MPHRFLHVFIEPKEGVTRETVEEKLNGALDWYRYRDGSYVVLTTREVNKWQSLLRELVDPGGGLLIVDFDPVTIQGWMAQRFWDWLKEARAKAKGKS